MPIVFVFNVYNDDVATKWVAKGYRTWISGLAWEQTCLYLLNESSSNKIMYSYEQTREYESLI